MSTISVPQDNLPLRASLLLSRWSLITALALLATTVLYSATGSAPSDAAMGQEFVRLMQAVRNPGLIRLQTVVESIFWLMLAGTLILYAGVFSRRSPIQAAFIAACGVAQVISSLGALLGSGVSDIAVRYATASPNQQAVLLESFLELQRVVGPLYAVGGLLCGAGFLLAAWSAWVAPGFPRWLAFWLAISGLLAAVLFIMLAAGISRASGFPIFVLDIVSLFSLNVAVAAVFWRPSALAVSEAPTSAAA